MSQSHGYPTRSRTSEETTNTDTAPIVTLLKRYQNYGLIWLEVFMTYGMNSSI